MASAGLLGFKAMGGCCIGAGPFLLRQAGWLLTVAGGLVCESGEHYSASSHGRAPAEAKPVVLVRLAGREPSAVWRSSAGEASTQCGAVLGPGLSQRPPSPLSSTSRFSRCGSRLPTVPSQGEKKEALAHPLQPLLTGPKGLRACAGSPGSVLRPWGHL